MSGTFSNVTANGVMNVAAISRAGDIRTRKTMQVPEVAVSGPLGVTGASTLGSVSASGSVSVTGTASVSGASTLGSVVADGLTINGNQFPPVLVFTNK